MSEINQSKNILVLGSKKDLILPETIVNKVYFANGAILLEDRIKKEKNYESILVTGARIYLRHSEIKEIILRSKPSRFIIRGDIHIDDIRKNFSHNFVYDYFKSNREINKFQKKFFKQGLFSVIMAELFYEKGIISKVIHFIKILLGKDIGVSTGFFSLLLALEENKEAKIIISGISFSEGRHNFEKKRDFINRARVDKFLFENLKMEYKNRIYTTDKTQSQNLNIKYSI